jgi:hypothetical protein
LTYNNIIMRTKRTNMTIKTDTVRALFIVFIVTMITNSVSAQKMKYDKKTNTISVDGNPHALMLRSNASLGGINNNFSIQNLNGKELIYIKLKTKDEYNNRGRKIDTKIGYEIIFMESGKSVWKQNTMGAKGAMKLVVKNKLIKNNEIDVSAERRFLLKY